MAALTYNDNAAGNVRSSASLSAGANANYDLDFTASVTGLVTVKNTPGGTVAGTAGLLVEFFPRYGTTPATTTEAQPSGVIPSVASTAKSKTWRVPKGLWNVKVTNLDASNAVTVEITSESIDE